MNTKAMTRKRQSAPVTAGPAGSPAASRGLRTYTGSGNLLFVSGMLPIENGSVVFVGRVGQELSIESGRKAAQLAVANALAVARDAVGLNRLAGVARLGVHMACAPDSQQHAALG